MIFHFITVFPNYYLLATNYLVPSLIVLFPILFLWLITKGKGMGFGDVKFSLIMGVLLGLKGGLVALYLAFITGGIVGLILVLLKKKKLKSKIAFGPFLAIGTIIMLFFADKV
jgi:leader peptidase (prepilin peptidase)/N-methyltransferase